MLNIKVLGPGCPNCDKLAALCKQAVTENELEAQVEKVTDISLFADYGVMMTPGLVINGKTVSSGKLPTKSSLPRWLIDAAG